MQLNKYLGDRPFWRSALRLALPIALQNLLISSFTLVDTVMIGAMMDNSEVPLAAVGMAGQWSWLMNILLFGFNSGAAVFIAQYWGVKDLKGIRLSYGLAFISATASALLFTAVGVFAPHWVLGMFTNNPAVIEQGVQYLRIASLSYLAIAAQAVASTVLRSTEQVKLPMYVSFVSVSMNAVLNAILIYGMGMGLRGAAIATAISAWISPVVLFYISFRKRNLLVAPIREMLGWPVGFVRRFVKTSLPVLLNESLWALGTVGYRLIFSNRNTDFYAAMTVYSAIEGITFVFFIGMCHASAVMVGKSVGAGDMRKAIDDGRRFAVLVPAMSAVVGLIMIASRGLILNAFRVDEVTRAMASAIIVVGGLEMLFRNIPYITIVGIFRAGGDTRTGLMYDVMCVWLIALPITFLSAYVLNLPLVWVYAIMLVSEDGIKNVLCVRRFISRKWIMPVTGSACTDPQAGEDISLGEYR